MSLSAKNGLGNGDAFSEAVTTNGDPPTTNTNSYPYLHSDAYAFSDTHCH